MLEGNREVVNFCVFLANSVAVKRHDSQSTSYKRKRFTGRWLTVVGG